MLNDRNIDMTSLSLERLAAMVVKSVERLAVLPEKSVKNYQQSLLFYFHDPMCSWCYAFNSSLTALQKGLPGFIGKKIVGGLAPDTTQPMPFELQKNIQQTWRRIEQTVPGMQFNYDFWIINTPVRSTYPACRAILAARQQGADFEDKMIGAIQSAYYQKAKNPSLQSTLLQCALEVGLAVDKFANGLASDVVKRNYRMKSAQPEAWA